MFSFSIAFVWQGDAAVFSAFTDAPMLWTAGASFDQLCADIFASEIVDLASWSQRQLSGMNFFLFLCVRFDPQLFWCC
jgi:hypothetical protein